jgi:hypothetical protein
MLFDPLAVKKYVYVEVAKFCAAVIGIVVLACLAVC